MLNKFLKKQIKFLKEEPLVTEEDIVEVKRLLNDCNIPQINSYTVVGVYANNTYVSENVEKNKLLYHIWYNNKYKKQRYLVVEDILLNYPDSKNVKTIIARLKEQNVVFTNK